jgi:hypothetical protein
MSKKNADPIYQLKVSLLSADPPVWRRLIVPAAMTLENLHTVLQIALGWTDSHLHMFEACGRLYGVPHPDDRKHVCNEALTRLDEVLGKPKDAMTYDYDFGDMWHHKLVLEKILPNTPEGILLPQCLAGARACPLEDCGGANGYDQLLEAISDPAHPDHEDLLEWAGEFDPEHFNPDEVNKVFSVVFFGSRPAFPSNILRLPGSITDSDQASAPMINRSVLIVRPRQPFLDWAAGLNGSDRVPDVHGEQTIYLIPLYATEEHAWEIVKYVYPEVFENELWAWHTNESAWPQRRSLATFKKWFSVEFHSVVVDLGDDEITDVSLSPS